MWHREDSYLELLMPKLYFEAKTPLFTPFLYRSTDQPIFLRCGYLPHRWGIYLFTPPPGSRARRPVGHSTCMSVLARRRAIMGVYRAAQTTRSRCRYGRWGNLTLTLTLTLTQHTNACTVTNTWQHLDRTVWAAR